jgi:hypothetical protein
LKNEHIYAFFKRILGKKETNCEKISSIINNLTKFKYCYNYCSIIAALHYRYYILNYKVKGSDYYDALHLVYLTDLDGFITNDKGAIWLCGSIFKDKKVITFENIKNYIK